MLNLNLQSIAVQDRIKDVEHAIMPIYRQLSNAIKANDDLPKDLTNYRLSGCLIRPAMNTVVVELQYMNEKTGRGKKYYAGAIVAKDETKSIKIAVDDNQDIGIKLESEPHAYDRFNSSEYSTKNKQDIDILREIAFPSALSNSNDYLNQAVANLDFKLVWAIENNRGNTQVVNEILPKIEIMNKHDDRFKWLQLPINEDLANDLTRNWIIIDYKAPFKISSTDEIWRINKLAELFNEKGINNMLDLYHYCQNESGTEELPVIIQKFTDENLNCCLAQMTPAQIVKNVHFGEINLSEPDTENDAEYFTVNGKVIRGADSFQVRDIIEKHTDYLINQFAMKNDLTLNEVNRAKQRGPLK